MSGKSRRHRGQLTPPSKKKKGQRSPQAMAFQPKEPATVKEQPAAAPAKVAPSLPNIPAPTATAFKHSELSRELRRIGIVAGVMLIALVLLAVFWR